MIQKILILLLISLLTCNATENGDMTSAHNRTDPIEKERMYSVHENASKSFTTDGQSNVSDNSLVKKQSLHKISEATASDISDSDKILWLQWISFGLIFIMTIFLVLLLITRRYVGSLKNNVAEQTKKLEELNKTLEQNARKRTSELKKLSERYDFAIQGTRDGLWDWDLVTNSVYFSPQWKSMIGFEDKELDNNYWTWENRIHPEDQEKTLANIQYCISGVKDKFENIHRLKHKDGGWVWILNRAHVFYDEEQKPVRMAGFHSNITRYKKVQDELKFKEQIIFQQSKMAAMGEMIENISHQWRQPLNIIGLSTMQIETAKMFGTLNDASFDKDLQTIQDQISYMSETINDFRKFFRNENKKERFDVSKALSETLKLIDSKIKNRHIMLIRELEANDTEGFRSEFIQAAINILNNAVYQLENFREKETKLLFVRTAAENNHIIVSITDNGGGIPAEAMNKLFVPYFTTKGNNVGTGIGLYLTHEIIVNHFSGTIKAENVVYTHEQQPQKGACFTITLPLADNPPL